MKSPKPDKILIENQYFPPISRVFQMMHANEIFLESKEHYQKRSFRNRCCIGSHHGRKELSVPLKKGKNNQQLITEVQISYEMDWPTHHWKTIQTNYGSAAYFIHYADAVKALIHSQTTYLFDLNKDILDFIQNTFQQNWKISHNETFELIPNAEVTDLRSSLNLKTYASWQMPAYYQVFSDRCEFLSNLSFLDLLFHLGPDAYAYLVNSEISRRD